MFIYCLDPYIVTDSKIVFSIVKKKKKTSIGDFDSKQEQMIFTKSAI